MVICYVCNNIIYLENVESYTPNDTSHYAQAQILFLGEQIDELNWIV